MGYSPDQVGALEFPFVVELLEYWAKFPPSHLLLRAMCGFDPDKQQGRAKTRRGQRAEQLGDTVYDEKSDVEQSPTAIRELSTLVQGTKHRDCAPPHIQKAIERFKKRKHLDPALQEVHG